jgi:aspartyl-tRNA(Asn)/glutamyl-tRNA(Gln) amidotransferase subunit A
MTDLADLSLVEAADAVRNGDATSVELLAACWRNMEATNPQLKATIWLDREGAEQAARAADRAIRDKSWLGPLHGVPMMHKDMYYQAGRLSTCGSALRKDWRPAITATVIEKLGAAGAYTFGGLNMAEFAQNPTGHNRAFGDCHNPWNPPYITGGSSSGSGVSVAVQLHGAGFRHRRLDPPAGGGVRRHRHQADADPRVALWRHAAVVQRRQCRAAHAHRARLRPRHDVDCRTRSARSDQFARAGAGL